jgi:hypothetical protein
MDAEANAKIVSIPSRATPLISDAFVIATAAFGRWQRFGHALIRANSHFLVPSRHLLYRERKMKDSG